MPFESHVESLGLYLSVPFCRSKCSFCNFASNVYAASHHDRYVDRLCEELRQAHAQAASIAAPLPRRVDTVYLGGGTPSVLMPELLHRLFAAIREQFQVDPDAEISMECAPGQIDNDILYAMVECGVNRVSLGVQSFIDREAATTGRLHNRSTTLRDIDRLRAAGIRRVSLDLIAGLPHQTLASWQESLQVLTDRGVEHASVYMLEIDDESRLGRELLQGGARYHAGAVPKDDTIAAMFELAAAHLKEHGLYQYELSNYAIAGHESKHNLKYWTRQPYLGIGLDAHSMLQDVESNHAVRFCCTDKLDRFLDLPTPWKAEPVSRMAALEEAWFLGLRLTEGIDLDDLRRQHGRAEVDCFLPTLNALADEDLLVFSGRRIQLTSRGQLLSNEIFCQLLEVGDEAFV